MTAALALGWALVAAAVAQAVAAPITRRDRVDRLARSRPARRGRALLSRLLDPAARVVRTAPPTRAVVRVVAGARRMRAQRRAARRVGRDLPALVDVLSVAVGAGHTPLGAIEAVSAWAPAALAHHLQRVGHAFALGAPIDAALSAVATEAPALRPLAALLADGAVSGAPIGPGLARLADECRQDERRRAEARARTVPVRLLFPLVFLVLPAFGVLTVVPAVLTGWRGS